jgi:hypothetical protein
MGERKYYIMMSLSANKMNVVSVDVDEEIDNLLKMKHPIHKGVPYVLFGFFSYHQFHSPLLHQRLLRSLNYGLSDYMHTSIRKTFNRKQHTKVLILTESRMMSYRFKQLLGFFDNFLAFRVSCDLFNSGRQVALDLVHLTEGKRELHLLFAE